MQLDLSAAEREARLGRFLARLAPVAAIFGLVEAWAADRFGDRTALVCAAVFLLFAGSAIVAGRWIGRGRVALASAAIAAALVLASLWLVWLQPELYPTLVPVPLLAAVVVMPYLARFALRAFLLVAVAAVGGIVWLGARLEPTTRLPSEFGLLYGTVVAAAVAACVVYLLWQYGARFEERIHDETSRRDRLETVLGELTGREREARRAALRDPLTDLANRRLLLDRLEQAMGGLERGEHRVGLLFLDLDRFKEVNDVHGHAAGDRVLAVLAARLAGAVRGTDTLGRLGGDEFVLVMPHLERADEAERAATRLLDRARQPLPEAWGDYTPSLSIGVAIAPDHAADAASLLLAADAAMYRAKSEGGGRLAWIHSHGELADQPPPDASAQAVASRS